MFQEFQKKNGVVQCYGSALTESVIVHNPLLKMNMTSVAQQQTLFLKPNRLYTKRKGLRDIKAIGLYECYGLLNDLKYINEMWLKPLLDVWIQVKHYYPLGTKIEREFYGGLVFSTIVDDLDLET